MHLKGLAGLNQPIHDLLMFYGISWWFFADVYDWLDHSEIMYCVHFLIHPYSIVRVNVQTESGD